MKERKSKRKKESEKARELEWKREAPIENEKNQIHATNWCIDFGRVESLRQESTHNGKCVINLSFNPVKDDDKTFKSDIHTKLSYCKDMNCLVNWNYVRIILLNEAAAKALCILSGWIAWMGRTKNALINKRLGTNFLLFLIPFFFALPRAHILFIFTKILNSFYHLTLRSWRARQFRLFQ